MRLLLDSHALIWAVDDPSQLSPAATAAIQDPANERLLSAASVAEIAIKVSLQKLSLTLPFQQWMNQAFTDLSLTLFPITVELIGLPSRASGNGNHLQHAKSGTPLRFGRPISPRPFFRRALQFRIVQRSSPTRGSHA